MSDPRVCISDVVPAARLARYRAVTGADDAALERFYLWGQQLSLAVFVDIAAVEVAMRSAMAAELAAVYGLEWYTRGDLFDEVAVRMIATAWGQAGLASLLTDPAVGPDVIEGKLVASLSFGFWVKLLGRGAHVGKAPMRERRIYDTLLWQPALSNALRFSPSRRDSERLAFTTQAARNRIAHHEHIIWGVPLPGQGVRLPVAQAHAYLLDLAGYISPQLRAWIVSHSTVAGLIAACPVDATGLSLA